MNRLSAKALEQIVNGLKLQRKPGVGEIWKHVGTGGKYRVLGFALEPSKPDPISKVVYTSHENGPNVLWTRDVSDFRKKFKKDETPIIICDFFRDNVKQ